MVSTSKEIVDAVTELESLKTKIDEQQTIVNNTPDDTDANKNKKASATSEVARLTKEFNEKSEEAKTKLTSLKAMDAELQFVKDFTSTDYLSKIDQLNGGTFNHESYKASNGVTIEYYVWVPNYNEEVEGLPLHIYLHGSGETGNGVLNCALPKMIADKTVVP
jgi:predicted peptidase